MTDNNDNKILRVASEIKQSYHKENSKADWSGIQNKLMSLGYNIICDENFRCKVKNWEKKYGILRKREEVKSQEVEMKLDELDEKILELKKEKYKLNDYKTAINKSIRDNARVESVKEIIAKEISNMKPYEQLITNSSLNEIVYGDNDLIVGLNDIHFGIDIDNYWNKYSPEIAKERLDKYLIEILKIKKLHNSTNCFVISAGDMVSGTIHLPIQLANRENLIKQVMGVSELVSWFLKELSEIFENVGFVCIAGNHSRLTIKENAPKDERLDDLIPWYVEARLQNLENVFLIGEKIDETVNILNIRGLDYLIVHGDNDKLESILKTTQMVKHEIYGVFMGHKHHNTLDWKQGIKVMMSGSLMGMDDFCVEKRILGKPQQLVVVCDENGASATYDVMLD